MCIRDRGVEVEKIDITVSDEEVDADLNQQRENNSRMVTVERAVADGDVAVIDFEGFVDDVAFEGGKGENYSLAIGSHSFIDNFEEQLIGKDVYKRQIPDTAWRKLRVKQAFPHR